MKKTLAFLAICGMYSIAVGAALGGVGLRFGTHEPYYTLAWLATYLPFLGLLYYVTRKEEKDGEEKEESSGSREATQTN